MRASPSRSPGVERPGSTPAPKAVACSAAPVADSHTGSVQVRNQLLLARNIDHAHQRSLCQCQLFDEGLAACGAARRPAGPPLTRGGSRGFGEPSGSGHRHGTSPPTPAVTGEQSAQAGMGWAPRIRSSRLNAVNDSSSSSSSGGGSGGGRSYQPAAVGRGGRCRSAMCRTSR